MTDKKCPECGAEQTGANIYEVDYACGATRQADTGKLLSSQGCYVRQLTAKDAECESLKRQLRHANMGLSPGCKDSLIEQLRMDIDEFKQNQHELTEAKAEIARLREAIKAMRDKLETPIKHEVGVKAGPPGEFFTCRACGSSLGKDGKHHENCLLLKPAAQAETGEPT